MGDLTEIRLFLRAIVALALRQAFVTSLLCSSLRANAPVPEGEGDRGSGSAIEWTDAERAWLRETKTIRYTFDPGWPPFSIATSPSAEPRGIDPDFLRMILERAQLDGRFVYAATWRQALQLLESGKVDVISGMARTEERNARFLFTQNYVSFPVAIITRKEAPFHATLDTLAGKTVALPEGYVTTETILARYPNVRPKIVRTAEAALREVAHGASDVGVENLVTASFIISKCGLTNLKISGITSEEYGLRLATRKESAVLSGILDKAISSLGPEERRAIVGAWIDPQIDALDLLRRTLPWLGATALLAGAIGVWLALTNRRLLREVDRRRQAEARLADSNRDKELLMEIAAHDLRSPLNTVMMASDIIRRDDRAITGGRVKEAVRCINVATVRMRRLVDNMLDFQAIDAGRLKVETRPTEIQPILREVVTAYEPIAESKAIYLEIMAPSEPLIAQCDAESARQIIDNLVSNALKYSPERSRVIIDAAAGGSHVRIAVTDRGPGIPADKVYAIFERFSFVDNRPTGGEKSHGLGLSIVKALTEAQGGRVSCVSTAGNGSTFVCELPAVPA